MHTRKGVARRGEPRERLGHLSKHMSDLTSAPLRQLPPPRQQLLLAAVEAIHTEANLLDDFPALVAPWLRRVTESDVAGYGEFDQRTGRRGALIDPVVPEFVQLRAGYARHRNSHRFWQMDLDFFAGKALRHQDVFTEEEFRRLPIYRDAYEPAGVTAVMQTAWAIAGGRVGFGVHRLGGPSFSEIDRAAFDALVPHLRRARELVWHRTLKQVDIEKRIALLHPQLSPRQREVLRWIGDGKDNDSIADLLGITSETVKEHLKAIYIQLGVESRLAAAVSLYDVDELYVPHPRALVAAGNTLAAKRRSRRK